MPPKQDATSSPSPICELLVNYLITPGSDFYLSTILYSSSGNSLDPLSISNIDLGTFTIEGVPVGVEFSDVSVRGLSNVQVIMNGDQPDVTIDGSTVTFNATLPNVQQGYQRPPSVPTTLQLNGTLNVTIGGEAMPSGTISATVNTISDAVAVWTLTDGGNLITITFSSASVTADTTTSNMKITVSIDSGFGPTLNQILNTPQVYSLIIQQLNDELAQSSILSQLSQTATNAARKALQ